MNEAELLEKIYPTTAEKVGIGIVGFAELCFIVGALKSARKGDFAAATFKSLVWGIISVNTSSTIDRKIALYKMNQQKGSMHYRRGSIDEALKGTGLGRSSHLN